MNARNVKDRLYTSLNAVASAIEEFDRVAGDFDDMFTATQVDENDNYTSGNKGAVKAYDLLADAIWFSPALLPASEIVAALARNIDSALDDSALDALDGK